MSNVIFALPRTDYGSYTDLYRLIDLSGYQHIFVDQIDATGEDTFIITCRNGELGAGWPDNHTARIILWDFEHRTEPQAPIPGVTGYWHMDAYEAKLLGYKYVPCGGHEGLFIDGLDGVEVMQGPKFDTCFIGYMVGRRERVANELRQRGVNAYINNSCWGEERDKILFHSRSYLHVHQLDSSPAIPALRMVVAAAYSLPFITESVTDPGIFANHILSSDYAHLADFAAMWARERHTQALDEKARGLHQLLCEELTFSRSIEMAL